MNIVIQNVDMADVPIRNLKKKMNDGLAHICMRRKGKKKHTQNLSYIGL